MDLRGRSGFLPREYDGLCVPIPRWRSTQPPAPQSSQLPYLAGVGARVGMLRSGAKQPRRQRTLPRSGHFGAPRVKFGRRAGTAWVQTPSSNEKVGSAPQLSATRGLRRSAVRSSGGECSSRGDERLGPGVRLRGAETPATRRKHGMDLERTQVRPGAGGGRGRVAVERSASRRRCGPRGRRSWMAELHGRDSAPCPEGERR